jgi:uridine kinase
VDRDELVSRLASAVAGVAVGHPVRVAVDGPPASGKTTLADELARVLRVPVVRATIDDFLVPRARRYRRGEFSAEGCYHDAHDHSALARVLLDPLGPGGDRLIQHTVYDSATDTVLSPPAVPVAADGVLIFDGVFLLRPELISRWDLRVLVTATPETMVARAVVRDGGVSSRAEVERRWRALPTGPGAVFRCGAPGLAGRPRRGQR